MGTFTDPRIVSEIILNEGRDPSEPDNPLYFVKLVKYHQPNGETVWGGVLNAEVNQGLGDRYEVASDYVKPPFEVIWKHPIYDTLRVVRG